MQFGHIVPRQRYREIPPVFQPVLLTEPGEPGQVTPVIFNGVSRQATTVLQIVQEFGNPRPGFGLHGLRQVALQGAGNQVTQSRQVIGCHLLIEAMRVLAAETVDSTNTIEPQRY